MTKPTAKEPDKVGFFEEAAADVKATGDDSGERGTNWKPEEGDILQGTLESARIQPLTDGSMKILVTVNEYGTDEKYAVWIGDSPFMLKAKFIDESPAIGSLIYLTYEGKKPTKDGAREYKVFNLRAQTADRDLWMELAKEKLAREQQAAAGAGSPTASGVIPDSDLEAPF